MIRPLSLALLLAVACPAFGQSIEGPTTVDVYRQVRLRVDGDYASILWDVEPAEVADLASEGGPNLEFTGPPGRYVVKAWTMKDGKQGKARHVVTISGTPPSPDPSPPPDDRAGPPPPEVAPAGLDAESYGAGRSFSAAIVGSLASGIDAGVAKPWISSDDAIGSVKASHLETLASMRDVSHRAYLPLTSILRSRVGPGSTDPMTPAQAADFKSIMKSFTAGIRSGGK